MPEAIIHIGDCLELLRKMPANSVHSCVTDPPYGLRFMGKRWDYDVPSVEVWKEVLRVLKPGAHLVAFGGSRTYHRMAVNVEDAGFEIRDCIMWLYGSGFPKSLDVSKAIDKTAGAEREVIGPNRFQHLNGKRNVNTFGTASRPDETAPATDGAVAWEGWGTALKPAHEIVIVGQKPRTPEMELRLIVENLIQKEAQLWSLLPVSIAEESFGLSPAEHKEACGFAQWSAGERCSIQDGLFAQMDTSQCASVIRMSLNIVCSWRGTLDDVWNHGNTYTTETETSLTTDLKTLRCLLSATTLHTIIQAATTQDGPMCSALPVARAFDAVRSKYSGILTLSALANAIAQEPTTLPDVGGAPLSPNHEPIIVARKPLAGTVAENVQEHGTGALNIDACRIPTDESLNGGGSVKGSHEGWHRPWMDDKEHVAEYARRAQERVNFAESTGRWPANVVHDGSDEVLQAFPGAPGQQAEISTTASSSRTKNAYGKMSRAGETSADRRYTERGGTDFAVLPGQRRSDLGSAARFFYCGKATAEERGADNDHPTVKPLALMQWLVRLVTPPGGVVLDPYFGSGSTGVAALAQGCDAIACEINEKYARRAARRIENDQPMFNRVQVAT